MLPPLTAQSHIVVVDPRPRDYRGLTAIAGQHSWNLHFLASGRAAMRFARHADVALWMINVALPDMSGLDVVEMLRDQLARGRIFAVANQYDADKERKACQCGANLYVCKDETRSIACRPLLAEFTPKASAPFRGAPLSRPERISAS